MSEKPRGARATYAWAVIGEERHIAAEFGTHYCVFSSRDAALNAAAPNEEVVKVKIAQVGPRTQPSQR